ncbi:MAG: hypothetical protein ACPH09_06610, partial [Pseudomonadales bacterium]
VASSASRLQAHHNENQGRVKSLAFVSAPHCVTNFVHQDRSDVCALSDERINDVVKRKVLGKIPKASLHAALLREPETSSIFG